MRLTLASMLRRTRPLFFLLFIGYSGSIAFAQQQGVLREVWTNVGGGDIESLLESSNYPSSPTIRDVMPSFAGPGNFGSNFGTRLSANLTPTLSGNYKFWIQGDDECALFFSSDGTPASAVEIASVPGYTTTSEWEKYPEQQSELIALEAGVTYYIEALHKEGGGGDHITVEWSLDGTFERSAIPQSTLSTNDDAPAFDPTRSIYLSAGADKQSYLPNTNVTLSGSAFVSSGSSDNLTYSWTQTAGTPTIITDSSTLAPLVTIPIAGDYTFELTVSNGADTRTDSVNVTVNDPLDPNTGSFTQEIWLNLGGSTIEDLINSSDYPNRPHLVRSTNTMTGPTYWGYQYGMRTRGLITPPETGDYVFYIMGDDSAALFLSENQSADDIELIAYTPSTTRENSWTQFPEQKSESIQLIKGQKYYIETLFRQRWGSDFHGVAWSVNGGPIEILGGEFFIAHPPETLGSPDFDTTSTIVVEAGANQLLYSPDRTAVLSGKTLRVRDSYEVTSVAWTQISGPGTATIAAPDEIRTEVNLPAEGVYTFQLTANIEGASASDVVTLTILPALNGNTGKFTREVWLDLSGDSVDALLASDRFPNRPDVVDQLSSLSGPINWGSRYGSRSSGYLIPTRTGLHTFYVTADDSAVLKLSPDANRNNATEIASSGRRSRGDYRDESQVSDPINLVAGQRYYIELLHKQNWGDDHFQVAWSFGEENAPLPIGGGNLEPFDASIADLNTELHEYAYAGIDRHYYAPTSRVYLSGKVLRVGDNDPFNRVEWSYIGNASGVEIDNPSKLDTKVTLPAVGQYTFRLTLEANDSLHYDDITLTVLPALSEETGGLLRAVWLDIEGDMVFDLLKEDPVLLNPSFEDILPNLEAPSDWTDYYGTRLVGYIHPPQTGAYQFWIAGNDSAELRISRTDQPNECVLVAEVSSSVDQDDWDRREEQTNEPVQLEAGKKYFIEVLHKEERNSDHLSVAWSGPGLNDREIITAGYLSPAYEAEAFAEEILVMAGEDQEIKWPDDTVALFGRVYDHNRGPELLSYQWTASNPSVEFDFPNSFTSNANFPAPGAYTLTLTATDGANVSSDSLTVTIGEPLDVNAGSITREVWIDIPGYKIQDLKDHPNFPNKPDIIDTLPSLDAPENWADYYGQRIRGYILPPETGLYYFYVSGDDRVEVSMNFNGESFEGLNQIINMEGGTSYHRWDQREDQSYGPVHMEEGKRYPVEVIHKEKYGSDHVALSWVRPGREHPEIIRGNFLSPEKNAELISENLIAIAPRDINQRWPRNTIDLAGRAFDMTVGPEKLATRWEKASGPGEVSFNDRGRLETNAHFTQPGVYEIRLYANDGADEIFDSTIVTIEEALSAETGGATLSLFTDISGNRVIDMVDSEKYPSAPDTTQALVALDSMHDVDDYFGSLVTGYLYAPVSGDYRFSVAGDDWVELWLSTDEDPDNKVMICFTPRPTEYYDWDMYPEYQTSTEIPLEEGSRYYIEIRHKDHNWRDHFAVAWLRPDEEEMAVIQGGFLSPVNGGAPSAIPEISIAGDANTVLYVGDTFVDPGYSAVDSDGNVITDRVVVDNHVDTAKAGTYSVRYQVINPNTGFAETVVRTVEVRTAASAPASFPAPTSTPPPPIDWTEPAPQQISEADASRFLTQATFGPTKESIAHLQEIGYSAWIDEQLALPATLHRPALQSILPAGMMEMGGHNPSQYNQNSQERLTTWWTIAMKSDDQLRQRMAFALSEITVISDKNTFRDQGQAMANYYDILVRHSFADYRDILQEVTLNPMMGQYLTLLRSSKESPDENYAREIMQLFTIGLHLLNPDGTPILDPSDNEIPTYDQDVILELARAFTGWSFGGSDRFDYSKWYDTDYFTPMIPFDEYHDFGSKELMGGFTLPQGLSPAEDMNRAIDHIFDHPNVGPFMAIRLIQRFTTSNPSPAYVYRVTQVFNDDGAGNRGNLGAVIKAILMDPEAREPETYAPENYGKLREPIIRLTHLLRAFEAGTSSNPPVYGRYPISNTNSDFGQSPLQAPTVFNFFLPDYAPPGPIMEAGLVAPEFATTTELSAVDTTNFLHRVIERGAPIWYRYATSVRLNLENLIANAENTDAILDELDILIMNGSMSSEMRAILKSTLDEIDSPEARAENALMLIISSPEFSIQK